MKRIVMSLVVALVVPAAAVLTSGCSAAQKQELEAEKAKIKAERDANFRDRQWNDGVRQVNWGLRQLDKFDQKLAEAEPESAVRHLRKASGHFAKAMTHFEKAEVGREKQGAIDDINAGNEALVKAYTDLEEDKVDAAQGQLDKANEHFLRADQTLAAAAG